MSPVIESRLDEMAAKIAFLEEEIAKLTKRVRKARAEARKAAGNEGAGAKAKAPVAGPAPEGV